MPDTQMNFLQQSMCFGTVLQNQDKDHLNQVKVQLDVIYEKGYNEVWAYLAAPFGGEKYGFCFVPEVGEQVLVLFPFGELPIVLASVFGAKAAPKECSNNSDNYVKVIKTKGGNLIKIQDEKDHGEIQIQTCGGNFVNIADENSTITVSDKDKKNSVAIDGKKGNITILADKSISLKVGGTAVIEADKTSLKLKSSKISIKADQALEGNGGQLKLSGQTAKINATGQMEISSSGMTQVKGSILKLN